jgi:hypothetical protein
LLDAGFPLLDAVFPPLYISKSEKKISSLGIMWCKVIFNKHRVKDTLAQGWSMYMA